VICVPYLVIRYDSVIVGDLKHRLLQMDRSWWQLIGEGCGQCGGSADDAMRGNVDRVSRVSLNAGEIVDDGFAVSILIEGFDAQALRECRHSVFAGPEPRGAEVEWESEQPAAYAIACFQDGDGSTGTDELIGNR
jgi:hypothetical protein